MEMRSEVKHKRFATRFDTVILSAHHIKSHLSLQSIIHPLRTQVQRNDARQAHQDKSVFVTFFKI